MAASSSWRPTTSIISRARTRARGCSGLYLYDDYARPLPADRIKAVKARVVTRETLDAATRTTKEIAAFPLVRRGPRISRRASTPRGPPAQMSAKVRFKSDAPEYRFDFTFTELYEGNRSPPPSTSRVCAEGRAAAGGLHQRPRLARPPAAAASAAVARACGAARRRASAAGRPAAIDPSLVPLPIPDTVAEIVAQLKTRSEQVGELIAAAISRRCMGPGVSGHRIWRLRWRHGSASSAPRQREAGGAGDQTAGADGLAARRVRRSR